MRRRLVIYLVVTFGLTWGLWIPAGIATGSFAQGLGSSVLMVALTTLGMFCPLVGALAANAACGRAERLDLGLRPQIEGHVRPYLAAWFLPTVVTLAGCVVFFAVYPQLFDPSASYFAEAARASGYADGSQVPLLLATQLATAILIVPFINMIPALGEEAGWRGMLFPTLCERLSSRAAALVVGVVWGLWHAPITMMGHNFGMGYPGFPVLGILSMVVFCTSLSLCLSYLRMRTGSVWSCALAHGALNGIAGVGVYFCLDGVILTGPSPAGIVAGIPLMALAVLCWTRLATIHNEGGSSRPHA